VIVLDASAVVEFLLRSSRGASAIAARIRAAAPRLAAPHLLDAEVGQVLRRYVRAGEMTAERAAGAMEDLLALPLVRYPHGPFLARAFELRANATFYDALYLALAEALRAPLLTCDGALARVPGHRARVQVVG
jgi:predicted nucleic acid-binding protein